MGSRRPTWQGQWVSCPKVPSRACSWSHTGLEHLSFNLPLHSLPTLSQPAKHAVLTKRHSCRITLTPAGMGRGNNSKAAKRACTAALQTLVALLAKDRRASALLGRCATPAERHIFQAIMRGLVANAGLQAVAAKSDKILFDELIQYMTHVEYRVNAAAYRRMHKIAALWLRLNPNHAASWFDSLPVVEVDRLPASAPYPPPGQHISEDPDISSRWRKHIYKDPLPDKHKKC